MRVFHELYILLILQILTELQILIVHWPGVACRVEHKKSKPSPSENLESCTQNQYKKLKQIQSPWS